MHYVLMTVLVLGGAMFWAAGPIMSAHKVLWPYLGIVRGR